MIGLDTNVVLRYLLADDDLQSKQSTNLIENILSPNNPGYINAIVFCELWWTMAKKLKIPKKKAVEIIYTLFHNPNIVFYNSEAVLSALERCEETKADFADCLIAFDNLQSGVACTLSFDQGAIEAGIMNGLVEYDQAKH